MKGSRTARNRRHSFANIPSKTWRKNCKNGETYVNGREAAQLSKKVYMMLLCSGTGIFLNRYVITTHSTITLLVSELPSSGCVLNIPANIKDAVTSFEINAFIFVHKGSLNEPVQWNFSEETFMIYRRSLRCQSFVGYLTKDNLPFFGSN